MTTVDGHGTTDALACPTTGLVVMEAPLGFLRYARMLCGHCRQRHSWSRDRRFRSGWRVA